YRGVMQRHAHGVTAIAVRRGATDLAMTATSVASASLRPPMMLFCVHSDARFREALDTVDTWAVSLLDGNSEKEAELLAMPGRPTIGQLTGISYSRGELSGAALLDNAQGWLECRTEWIKTAGEHDVVVGRVLSARLGVTATGGLVHRLGRYQVMGR
ncbi:MAG TPA: flavin reductase family protein, partial [Actinomycetaceae bacterium]|nr:flavin reductase family protein [Actinomycetaceae bacterium]